MAAISCEIKFIPLSLYIKLVRGTNLTSSQLFMAYQCAILQYINRLTIYLWNKDDLPYLYVWYSETEKLNKRCQYTIWSFNLWLRVDGLPEVTYPGQDVIQDGIFEHLRSYPMASMAQSLVFSIVPFPFFYGLSGLQTKLFLSSCII